MNILGKIKKKLIHLRLQPIRVLCFHYVWESLDESYMYAPDWISTHRFFELINEYQLSGYEFISLSSAYRHICRDVLRCKKYAVLTFDDGYKEVNVYKWLLDNRIPFTLFINGKVMDGQSYRYSKLEKYLKIEEIFAMDNSLIEIGNHGWEHIRIDRLTKEEFIKSIDDNQKILSSHSRYVDSFFCYPYGYHTFESDRILHGKAMIPVLLDGQKNYNDKDNIHRELVK